jgi:ATP-dependent 26S proteasome regulatory subunit
MPEDDPLLASLRAAVLARPDDPVLRLHLAGVLIEHGLADEAVSNAAAVLAADPTNARALEVIRAGGRPATETEPAAVPPVANQQPANAVPGFDWTSAEQDLSGIVEPMFVDGEGESTVDAYDADRPTTRLDDVGGMQEVKDRLESAFLAPIRHPELRATFAKSLRGGLMMYGPPGCGKTFLARAVAGEIGGHFISVALNDVLDMYTGQSERNLHEVFETARRHSPCVLFLDEIDAIGQKRSQTRNNAMRTTVNQLLTELDDVQDRNRDVFVLAATNMPWDVDPAMRRPGRLDRTLLVLPPDQPAREAILRHHLVGRPVAGIDVGKLAKATDGYSGADLAHICETAAERALIDSARSGTIRMISMADLQAALGEVKPSIGPWLETARNVAMFANEGGQYDELLRYLKKRRMV